MGSNPLDESAGAAEMTIGKWIIAGFAMLIVYGYFHEHHLDDYYTLKAWIKEVMRKW